MMSRRAHHEIARVTRALARREALGGQVKEEKQALEEKEKVVDLLEGRAQQPLQD